MDFADISSYQAGADLAAYARAGHDRILIKATEGVGYENPYFASWWKASATAGLARGAYHFARPSKSTGPAEADRFVRAVQAAGGLGPQDWLCLDVEDPDELGPKTADHAAAFCARMVQLGYAGGVIYSGTWYLGPVGLTAVMLPERWQWLHLADYRTAVPDSALPLPSGWSPGRLLARQYTDKAVQQGIPGRSDRNRVLREWLPGVAAAPEEDDMPAPSQWTQADRDAVGRSLADYLSAQMRQLVTTDPATGKQVRMADTRIDNVGLALGLLVLRSSFGLARDEQVGADTAAIRAGLAEVLGPDHPATAALSSAPRQLTVDDLVALAPTVPPEVAARVVAAYAPRLTIPVTPTP